MAYASGKGVPNDYVEAAKWYRLAAEQGYAGAQFALGYIYEGGRDLPKDYVEAAKWYRLAAEQGDVDAQCFMGVMYGTGKGVPKDDVEAYKWFNLAAAQRRIRRDLLHANAARERDTIGKRMTPEQIAEAQKLSSEWKPTGKR